METIDKIRARHKQEIESLQDNCEHENISEWKPHYWAPGHGSHFDVKVCLECGKQVKESRQAPLVFIR